MHTLFSLQSEKPCFDHLHGDCNEDRPCKTRFFLNPV
jgi:hypothetical protein